jgi:hypothetical protein
MFLYNINKKERERERERENRRIIYTVEVERSSNRCF